MKKLILLVIIGISLHCNAQISRDSAYEFLKTNILPNDWENKEINIFVSKELVIENTIITTYIISYDTLAVSPNYKTWFFYIDENPRAGGLRHDSKFIFINDENNFVVVDMESPYPHCIKNMDFLSGIRPRKVKPIRPKPTPLDSILLEKKKSEKNAKSGYVEVTLNKDLLERNRELQQLLYSFNKDYATAAADKLGEWETFVAKYGYSFSSDEAIAEYNTLCDYEEQYIKKFTAKERAQIKKLVNQ